MAKIAMITGASAGIGQACAEIFAKNGYNLILSARRYERLEKLSKRLSSDYGIVVQVMEVDVQNKEEVINSWEMLSEDWKQIDVLINNAGLSLGLEPIYNGEIDDWDRMIDTNIKGLLYVSKVVIPRMKENESGHIINIGSIAGKEVYPNGNVYCATKHAVDALSKSMRVELLPYSVKVTVLHPGAVETEFSVVRFKGDTHRAEKVYDGFDPLLANDIADAAWYVASRPQHVNINEMLIMPTNQANSISFNKNLN
ncbi:SDR family NAD(P)-dependent oxidoreductase [Albibacterium sp.]|uniref:SDR family NAD(P)-dependent oxidoreductase n=1 Tax=Albibacterium sp. TaxID=2952885 RepID=UPI002C5E6B91|nr:SDR family NAD(P)-dependent oxidoreductase [Albibacterium sp.]HUH17909.1 SDR family NAD(P)-dependent oxidoreductase [Albibacterium sp.]